MSLYDDAVSAYMESQENDLNILLSKLKKVFGQEITDYSAEWNSSEDRYYVQLDDMPSVKFRLDQYQEKVEICKIRGFAFCAVQDLDDVGEFLTKQFGDPRKSKKRSNNILKILFRR